MLLIKLWRIL